MRQRIHPAARESVCARERACVREKYLWQRARERERERERESVRECECERMTSGSVHGEDGVQGQGFAHGESLSGDFATKNKSYNQDGDSPWSVASTRHLQ